MQLSEARIAASKANGARSKGPKSAEGKEISRRNAFKHGLCATVLVAEDEAKQVPADGTLGGWLIGQVSLYTLRIGRCQRIERAIRDRIVARAKATWDEDRRRQATLLGGKLAADPAGVVARLRESLQGVDWLLARWASMARLADTRHMFRPQELDGQVLDLLGTPRESRDACGVDPTECLDRQGRVVERLRSPAAVARRQIAELEAHREALIPLDRADREAAEADLTDDSHPDLKRHRRYEATLHNRLRWALKQLEQAAEAEETVEEVEAEAPEVVEPVSRPPLPISRVDKKLARADARREAHRRKLEQLRN